MFDQNLYTASCILCYDMLLQTSNFSPALGSFLCVAFKSICTTRKHFCNVFLAAHAHSMSRCSCCD